MHVLYVYEKNNFSNITFRFWYLVYVNHMSVKGLSTQTGNGRLHISPKAVGPCEHCRRTKAFTHIESRWLLPTNDDSGYSVLFSTDGCANRDEVWEQAALQNIHRLTRLLSSEAGLWSISSVDVASPRTANKLPLRQDDPLFSSYRRLSFSLSLCGRVCVCVRVQNRHHLDVSRGRARKLAISYQTKKRQQSKEWEKCFA